MSQIPAQIDASRLTMAESLRILNKDLQRPECSDPETRLRTLLIKGIVETNYDAALAHTTWGMVRALALQRHHLLLANRAMGDHGIAAFILGDAGTAQKEVYGAYTLAKFVVHDNAAQIRFASAFGAGLVANMRFQEALGPLNEAIRVAHETAHAPYPGTAVANKIDALRGLQKLEAALDLSGEAMRVYASHNLKGHQYQMLETRGHVYEELGNWPHAIADYTKAVQYAKELGYWIIASTTRTMVPKLSEQSYGQSAMLDQSIARNTQSCFLRWTPVACSESSIFGKSRHVRGRYSKHK